MDEPPEAGTLAAGALEAWGRGDRVTADRLVTAAVAAVEHRPRFERQQVQIVRLAIAGELERAWGLASEHLAEFPEDELVRMVLGPRRGTSTEA